MEEVKAMSEYSAAEVASWFLERNQRENLSGDMELISHLKLQKLLYYAQGCSLALNDYPLFDEDFEAWKHGPVVPKIYDLYSDNGANGITKFAALYRTFDELDESLLEEVYKEFGQYTAWKLRDMTHEEIPWRSAYKEGLFHIPITKESIKEYFVENYIDIE